MMQGVIGGLVRGVLGRGCVALVGLLLTVTLPRMLSTDEVGRVYFAISVGALLSIFARLGMDNTANAITANASDALIQDRKRQIIGASLVLGMAFLSAWVLLVTVILPEGLLLGLSSTDLLSSGLLGFALAISYILFQLYRIDGHVFLGALTRGFFHNLVILVSLPLLISASVGFDLSLLLACGLVSIVALANLILYSARNGALPSLFDTSGISRLVSARFLLYSFLLYLITDADYYFIKAYLSDAELGIYASMKRLAVLIAIYIDIAHLVLPRVYRNALNRERISEALVVFRRLALLGFVASVVLMLVLGLYASPIFLRLWGPDYLPGISVLNILLLSFALSLAFGFSEMWLLLNENKNALLASMVFVVGMCFALNIMLTPVYGLTGAAWAFSGSSILLRLIMMIYVRRKYNVWLMMWWR
ncbi:polysaccharide biosynthesis-like protein [Alcanivorax sp. S71-1-4]|uniref:polysaccharide biosynthesis C-terminal domain-containing protein n=1 Tax=Alcanivorax sp. S71-1-4 TaxID=1177159 RepID=UPI0013599005|nr:polysaccharide biosynthesis C-terminal domain-containing protein [Alcanivorax sp. S71-1-4]KAF0809831.1 polysaccharide biosynthesis-like protein [Alcanivorax sp. S71-1-4]